MLKNLAVSLRKQTFSEKSVPWILLIACVLAFGLLIPSLGYYQDDWTFVYNHYRFGNAGVIDFLRFDGRPFTAWIFILGFYILGYKPLAWQIATLLLKWLTAVFLWGSFRIIWSNAKWQNLTVALIFSLYPFFTLQPLAVTYAIHWTGYLLYALSIYFMLQSLTKRYWLYTVLSVLTQALCLFTLEYFAGIDLLRPFFLWLVLSAAYPTFREKLAVTMKRWGPYLIVFLIYFIWRGFLYTAPAAGRNAPTGLTGLLTQPFTTLMSIALVALPDLVLILVSSWYKILDPTVLDLSQSIHRYAILLGIASFFLFQHYLSHQKTPQEKTTSPIKQMMFIGCIAVLLGLVPAYAGGYVIYTKIAPWNSRFSLGSLFGAALIITALIDIVVASPRTRWIIISVLLGLLVGWQLRSTNDFRWGWDKQVDFYRQLYLRAPALEPGTDLLSEEEFLPFMGNYSTSYGINLIYDQGNASDQASSREADYWLFTFADFSTNLDAHLQGEPFSIGTEETVARAGIRFQGVPQGSVVMTFVPENGQCLWIIRPEYAVAKALSDTTRKLASLSNVDRIQQGPQNKDSFLLKYLYTNPVQDWCYYYEKADLADQYEEWNQVLQLWDSAQQNGVGPENGFEYLPFIRAFAHTGDWEAARKLTRISEKTMQGIDPLLCNIWEELGKNASSSPDKENSLNAVKEELKCSQY